jgi:carboxymethylenebutenolidase
MIISESQVEIATPSGPMRTYVLRPAAATATGATAPARRYPGLIFFSEIFQRTAPIGRMAAFFAGHGLVVAVPEIFHELEAPGTVLGYDKAGADRGNADKRGKPIEAFDADIAATLGWLGADAGCTGRVGAFGVCAGGHLAFRAALNPGVSGSLCAYATDLHQGSMGARGSDSLPRARDIRGELAMVWGRQDPHVPFAGRVTIHQALEEAGINFTWHEVNGQHAFMRDDNHRHDPELTALVNRLSLDLFARTLHG